MRTNEELAIAIQKGNKEALLILWAQCYGFVCLQANKWAEAWKDRPSCDRDDFVQSGFIALNAAVRAFQADRGSFINLLAMYLKTEFSKVAGCYTSAQMKEPLNNAISLDSPAYNDDDSETTMGETIPIDEPGFEEVEEAIDTAQINAVLREAIKELPEKQSQVIEAHYLQRKPYSEIANIMHISAARTGQIAKEGIKSLRNSRHVPTLSELLWGQRNFYMHTGYTAWKESGCSVQEWSIIWKEKEIQKHKLRDTLNGKVRYCVEVLGMDRGQAERLFRV